MFPGQIKRPDFSSKIFDSEAMGVDSASLDRGAAVEVVTNQSTPPEPIGRLVFVRLVLDDLLFWHAAAYLGVMGKNARAQGRITHKLYLLR